MPFADDLERLIASAQADNDAIERAKLALSQFLAGMQDLSTLIDHADEWRLALYRRMAATLPVTQPPHRIDNSSPISPEELARIERLAAMLTPEQARRVQ